MKPFIYKYNWKGLNFRSEKNDSEKFEKNNVALPLNVLYAKNERNISDLCFKT